mgnify:CR=1 FL=1
MLRKLIKPPVDTISLHRSANLPKEKLKTHVTVTRIKRTDIGAAITHIGETSEMMGILTAGRAIGARDRRTIPAIAHIAVVLKMIVDTMPEMSAMIQSGIAPTLVAWHTVQIRERLPAPEPRLERTRVIVNAKAEGTTMTVMGEMAETQSIGHMVESLCQTMSDAPRD